MTPFTRGHPLPGAACDYVSDAILSLSSPPIVRCFGALLARMPRMGALVSVLALTAAASPLLRRAGSASDDGGAAQPVELMSQEEVKALHANFTRARELQTTPAGTVLIPSA